MVSFWLCKVTALQRILSKNIFVGLSKVTLCMKIQLGQNQPVACLVRETRDMSSCGWSVPLTTIELADCLQPVLRGYRQEVQFSHPIIIWKFRSRKCRMLPQGTDATAIYEGQEGRLWRAAQQVQISYQSSYSGLTLSVK